MFPDVVTARKNSDVSEPLTAQQAEVLDKLLNPAGSLFRVGGRLSQLEDAVFSGASSVEGKSGNTIIVTKTTAGQYVSLQAAVDAASAGDVVVVGAGSWGAVTLKAGVSLMGLQPPLADEVVLSSLTFAPASGSASANTVYVSNLRISNNADVSSLVLGSASAPVRVTMSGVRVYRNNAAANTAMVSCIGDVADSSIYMKDCMFTHEGAQVANSITLLSSSSRYLDLVACQFSAGGRCLDVTAGLTAASLCRFETSSEISALRVASGTTLTIGNSFIRNLGSTSPTGIELAGTCAASDCVFDVAPGTGRAIQGAGTLVRNNLVAGPGTNHLAVGVTQVAFTALST